jgi:hypothetical protein
MNNAPAVGPALTWRDGDSWRARRRVTVRPPWPLKQLIQGLPGGKHALQHVVHLPRGEAGYRCLDLLLQRLAAGRFARRWVPGHSDTLPAAMIRG